jgi:hypothetical protein
VSKADPDNRHRNKKDGESAANTEAGAADAHTAAGAALHLQSILRRDYDLVTD